MRLRLAFITAAVVSLTSSALPVLAADYYVAPAGAAVSGSANGSVSSPWPTVDAALRSGKVLGGDTILLKDGRHGALIVKDASFATPVTIRSQNAKSAHVEYVAVEGTSRNVVIQNLSVWPTNPYVHTNELIFSAATSSDLKFVGIDARGGQDADKFLTWSAAEWVKRATDGAMIYSPRTSVIASTFTGVRFGIAGLGDDVKVARNRINGFSSDGLRGNGARGVFVNNTVTNCVSVDENHADGFQAFSWSSITGLVIERNTIIEWTEDKNHPLRCALQGIGMFDGFYDNLIIRNNIVAVRMGHGISVFGARNATITHNTVVANDPGPGANPTWIGVFDHKNGTPSSDVVVANNLAMQYMGATSAPNRITFSNNAVISDPAKVFENIADFNYRPKASSGFIDKANPIYAPKVDILRNMRPYQAGPDMGAIEAGSPAFKPAATSTAAAAMTDEGATAPVAASATTTGTATTGTTVTGTKATGATKTASNAAPSTSGTATAANTTSGAKFIKP